MSEGPANEPIPESSPQSADPADPASSLRAAALKTLKSKRRKPASDSPAKPELPTRPPPPSEPQLDYGQEDIASSPPEREPSPPASDTEAGQLREEGEISDSEEAAAAATAIGPKPATPKPSTQLEIQIKRSPSPRSATIVPKVESPTQSIFEALNRPVASLDERPIYAVDADHVRPGLEMNQSQYDTAKDVVLDLLGWAVPPEYLLDCGVSREIIFYVFSELNLRLPDNLDVTGLLPYLPSSLSTISSPDNSTNPATSHPLPERPNPLEEESSTTTTQVAASSTSQNSITGSLHDMERQRRQELLARKAVQASRKAKPSNLSADIPSDSYRDQDVEMTSVVPTELVDDFLNSIGSVADADSSGSRSNSQNMMDVDEIPGLSRSRASAPDDTPSFASQLTISPSSSTFPNQMEPDIEMTSANGDAEERLTRSQALQRRGSKRPVAADFVDSDGGRGSPNITANGHSSPQRILRRKLGGSFASVSTMRRCVIDLSDSEGDGDEDSIIQDVADYERDRYSSGYSSPAPGLTKPASMGNGWDTFQATVVGPHRTMSPAALMEKEKEIVKMRQLIAQREQTSRAKKLTRLNTTSTIDDDQSNCRRSGSMDPASALSPPEQAPEGNITRSVSSRSPSATAAPTIDEPNNTVNVTDDSEVPSRGYLTPEAHDGQPFLVEQIPSLEDRESEHIVASIVDVDPTSSTSTQMENLRITTFNPQKQEESLVPEQQSQGNNDSYSPYRSPFDFYPLLRSKSRPLIFNHSTSHSSFLEPSVSFSSVTSTLSTVPSSLSFTRSRSSSASSVQSHDASAHIPFPDLLDLKLSIVGKLLDPSKRVCQYEVPGGGVCRDESCQDTHLSRIVGGSGSTLLKLKVEPDDEETASYLSTALPAAWLSSYGSTTALALKITDALQRIRLDNPTIGLEERVARALTALEPVTT
ncbi:hypothetical protein C8J56DRAFT_911077 [Mycena floridula]|nr:hypothetical protein C8J56DRAFT_911077 [Mycena floridula]